MQTGGGFCGRKPKDLGARKNTRHTERGGSTLQDGTTTCPYVEGGRVLQTEATEPRGEKKYSPQREGGEGPAEGSQRTQG